jgi:hypothetical protein
MKSPLAAIISSGFDRNRTQAFFMSSRGGCWKLPLWTWSEAACVFCDLLVSFLVALHIHTRKYSNGLDSGQLRGKAGSCSGKRNALLPMPVSSKCFEFVSKGLNVGSFFVQVLFPFSFVPTAPWSPPTRIWVTMQCLLTFLQEPVQYCR